MPRYHHNRDATLNKLLETTVTKRYRTSIRSNSGKGQIIVEDQTAWQWYHAALDRGPTPLCPSETSGIQVLQ